MMRLMGISAVLASGLALASTPTKAWQNDLEFIRIVGEVAANIRPKLPFGDKASVCVGQHVVDTIGPERLAMLGINKQTARKKFSVIPLTQSGFTDNETVVILDAVERCAGFGRVWEYFILHGEDVKKIEATPENLEAVSACIAEVIDDEDVRHVFGAMFTRSEPEFLSEIRILFDRTTGCFETVFCGSATILGSTNTPMTTAPGGLVMGGGGSSGITMMYSTPIFLPSACPFKIDERR